MKYSLLKIVQILIFLSYALISLCVFETFFKSRKYFHNFFLPNFLVITYGLFLMLCAITHILSISESGIYYDIFLILCMIDSLVAAITTVYMRDSIQQYVSMRVNTTNYYKNQFISSLMDGYDLKISVIGNEIVSGTIKDKEDINGLYISGQVETGGVIEINNDIYRILHVSPLNVDVREHMVIEESLENNRPLIVYGHNITKEIRASQIKEKIIKSRMDLCMSTAHDIRTPMFTVKFLSDTVSQCMSLSEEVRPHMEEIGVNVDLLDMICSQMMDAGRLLSGESMQPTLSSTDIRENVNRMRLISKYINQNKLELNFNVASNVPKRIITDNGWTFQIIMNYVTNALKYTHSGFVHLNIDYNEGNLIIKVKDSGLGIPDEFKKSIFDTFVTLNENKDTSKGVGLYSVATKVKTLGGTYGVLDNEGRGSIFWCEIPAPKDRRTLSNNHKSKKSILIVDDLPIVRKIIQRAVSGHEIYTRINGKEALEEMKSKEFDLVLMDVGMPVMNGIECVEKFRKIEKTLNREKRQIIACISANSHNPGGIFDYMLGKPIDFKMLHFILSG